MALLGPDGAGKSTLARGISQSSPLPVRTYYMGMGQERLPRLARLRIPVLRQVILLAHLWSRYAAARIFVAMGGIAVFDRYTYEALLPPRQHLNRVEWISRWIHAHACPAPDLVLILDVSGVVTHDRKHEHTPERLEKDRRDYLELTRRLSRAQVIDAARSEKAVLGDVMNRIRASHEKENPAPGALRRTWEFGRLSALRLLPLTGRRVRRWRYCEELHRARQMVPEILGTIPCLPDAHAWRLLNADWSHTDVAVLEVAAPGNAQRAFIKVPWTASGEESLQAQAHVLTALRQDERLEGWRPLLPSLLGEGRVQGRPFWMESGLPGEEARPHVYEPGKREAMHRAATAAISELHRRTAMTHQVDASAFRSWVCEPLQLVRAAAATLPPGTNNPSALERLADEMSASLAGREVAVSWIHGDFWASNVLMDREAKYVTGIVDWDRASPAGLPLHDLVHLLVQTRKLLRRDSEQGMSIRAIMTGGWSPSERRILRSGLLPVPLDEAGTRIIMVLYWLDRMKIYLQQAPGRAKDRQWVEKNIGPVLPCL